MGSLGLGHGFRKSFWTPSCKVSPAMNGLVTVSTENEHLKKNYLWASGAEELLSAKS